MKQPRVSKPRSATKAFTLSRTLPRLNLPQSVASVTPARPKPSLGKPGKAIARVIVLKKG